MKIDAICRGIFRGAGLFCDFLDVRQMFGDVAECLYVVTLDMEIFRGNTG